MARPRVQVLLDDAEMSEGIRDALECMNATVELAQFTADPSKHPFHRSPPDHFDARLLVTADAARIANGSLDRLLKWCDRDACATLVVSEQSIGSELATNKALQGRPIGFASNPTRDDLVGRLSGMCELRGPLEAMQTELATLRRRERAHLSKLESLDEQLREAAAVQRDLLPTELPKVNGADIQVTYRPAEQVSGDIYDVARLDDTHVAFFVADATGHGLAAGFVSTLVRAPLRERSNTHGGRGLPAPDQLLAGANKELIDAALDDCHCVAAVCAIYDETTHRITLARAGASYPILVRKGERPRRIISDGLVLGACSDSRFETVEITLRPGDTLLLHTDGLDALLLDHQSGLGCSELERTEWFNSLGKQPITRSLEHIDSRLTTASDADWHVDDVTILALELQ